jgi:ferredoxin
VVVTRELPEYSTARELSYHGCERCDYCLKACPVSAISRTGIDKQKCYRHLLEVDRYFEDLPLTDVCGKCACGPCAVLSGRDAAR